VVKGKGDFIAMPGRKLKFQIEGVAALGGGFLP